MDRVCLVSVDRPEFQTGRLIFRLRLGKGKLRQSEEVRPGRPAREHRPRVRFRSPKPRSLGWPDPERSPTAREGTRALTASAAADFRVPRPLAAAASPGPAPPASKALAIGLGGKERGRAQRPRTLLVGRVVGLGL